MTTEEIILYYSNLLILQYRTQPKAIATMEALVTPIIMDQLPLAVQNAFEIGTAVGTQLDVLGKYTGVTRYGVGFDGQPITLGDFDFTQLIKLAIITNNSGSSLFTIDTLLNTYFPNEIFAFDDADMHMSYLISSSIGSQNLVEMFVTQNLLPKPMGVELASVIYLPAIGIFGMPDYRSVPSTWNAGTIYPQGATAYSADAVIYQSLVADNLNHALTDTAFWQPIVYPFNDYLDYQTSWHWLDYTDAIILV